MMRILVVDDEDVIRGAFRTLLEHDGHVVVDTGTARHAIDLLSSDIDGFGLALIDWELHTVMTGAEVAIHALQRGVPVFMVTGHTRSEIRAHWRDPLAGVIAFVEKPVKWSELRALIARVQKSRDDTPIEGMKP